MPFWPASAKCKRNTSTLGATRSRRRRAKFSMASGSKTIGSTATSAKEQRFIDRFAAHAAKAAQVQSRVKALEKIEKIQLPKRRRVVHFDFRIPPRSGEQVAVLEDVTKAYGRRVVHDGLTLTIRRGERWCAMGKNGAGKSTLLKMVAGQLTPDRGLVRMGASVKMGYFAQQSLD